VRHHARFEPAQFVGRADENTGDGGDTAAHVVRREQLLHCAANHHAHVVERTGEEEHQEGEAKRGREAKDNCGHAKTGHIEQQTPARPFQRRQIDKEGGHTKQRRQFSAKFKFQVGLEALKELKTINEIASQHEVHPTQVKQRKKQLQEEGANVFSEKAAKAQQAQTEAEATLYEQIGRLKVENDWLKKKLPESIAAKCALIEPNDEQLSVRQQCDLLGLNRSTYYYVPATESPLNLELMRLIDEQYMRTPFYGWPRMTIYLHNRGYAVNHKRRPQSNLTINFLIVIIIHDLIC